VNESARLAFQVAIIVLAARGLGRIAECWLKQPSVIGELLAGVIIGPYALGGPSLPPLQLWGLALPGIAPLFSVSGGGSFEGPVLHGFTVLAGAVLLFRGGLETVLGCGGTVVDTGADDGHGGHRDLGGADRTTLATISCDRRAVRITPAVLWMIRSPSLWPYRSLIILKLSRST